VTENKCLLRLCHIDPRQERMSASARQWKPDLEAQALYWELARVAGASSTWSRPAPWTCSPWTGRPMIKAQVRALLPAAVCWPSRSPRSRTCC